LKLFAASAVDRITEGCNTAGPALKLYTVFN